LERLNLYFFLSVLDKYHSEVNTEISDTVKRTFIMTISS